MHVELPEWVRYPGITGKSAMRSLAQEATGMRRQCWARCAPPWQMAIKSNREEGLRHARSPDKRFWIKFGPQLGAFARGGGFWRVDTSPPIHSKQ